MSSTSTSSGPLETFPLSSNSPKEIFHAMSPAANTTGNDTALSGVTHAPATPNKTGGDSETAGTAVAIVITCVLIAIFIVFIYMYTKRKGRLGGLQRGLSCCRPGMRQRRSSTSSSRGALEEHEIVENAASQKGHGDTEGMFTIDDFDDALEAQEPKEEYFYDEVFGKSQFEDETTNNSMRQLYSSSEAPDEEMLDFDFETLGIKIDDDPIDAR